MPSKLLPPPAGSGVAGRKLWRAVLSKYELEDHEAALLERACRVADSCALLQAVVDRDGPMGVNRFGDAVAHPALVELRMQSIVFARLVAALRVPLGLTEAGQGRGEQHGGLRGVYGFGGGK